MQKYAGHNNNTMIVVALLSNGNLLDLAVAW